MATSRLEPRQPPFPECHKVPRLPREMHFHTWHNITFSHYSHRQRDDEVRDPRHATTRKQSATPRPPRKNTRTLSHAFGKIKHQKHGLGSSFICSGVHHPSYFPLCWKNLQLQPATLPPVKHHLNIAWILHVQLSWPHPATSLWLWPDCLVTAWQFLPHRAPPRRAWHLSYLVSPCSPWRLCQIAWLLW